MGEGQFESGGLMLSGGLDSADLDLTALLTDELSPRAQRAALAAFAREQLVEAEKVNRDALGFTPGHTVTVDGIAAASEDAVRPDGTIVYSFDLARDLLGWIAEQLTAFAPVHSGRFRRSFDFLVEGVLADLDRELPQGREFVFMSMVPYAGKIEGEHRRPESRQAPNGVFEAVAVLAQQQFPGTAISFSYRSPFAAAASGVADTPAITIRLGA
jgi:hypothetical protein